MSPTLGTHSRDGQRVLSESISFEELNLRLEEERPLDKLAQSATSENPLHELVVKFYFKGGHPELGCEFLHKSFASAYSLPAGQGLRSAAL